MNYVDVLKKNNRMASVRAYDLDGRMWVHFEDFNKNYFRGKLSPQSIEKIAATDKKRLRDQYGDFYVISLEGVKELYVEGGDCVFRKNLVGIMTGRGLQQNQVAVCEQKERKKIKIINGNISEITLNELSIRVRDFIAAHCVKEKDKGFLVSLFAGVFNYFAKKDKCFPVADVKSIGKVLVKLGYERKVCKDGVIYIGFYLKYSNEELDKMANG